MELCSRNHVTLGQSRADQGTQSFPMLAHKAAKILSVGSFALNAAEPESAQATYWQ